MLDWYPVISYPDTVAIERPGSACATSAAGSCTSIARAADSRPWCSKVAGRAFAIDWMLVQPDIAKTTRVCSHDRAGLGLERAERPAGVRRRRRSPIFTRLLQAAGEKPPFVMVGAATRQASYARAYHLRYARRGRLAFVFVDARTRTAFVDACRTARPSPVWSVAADQSRAAVEAMIPGTNRMPPPPMNPSTDAPFDKLPPERPEDADHVSNCARSKPGGAAARSDRLRASTAEQRGDRDAARRIGESAALGAAPLVVLTPANVQDPGWKAMQEQLTALSSNAQQPQRSRRSGGDLELVQSRGRRSSRWRRDH